MALQIPDKSIIKSIITDWALTPSKRGYVAPTVFLMQGKATPRLNYYSSLQKAFNVLKYLSNAGGKNETPAGSVTLKQDGTAQTVGINCDFYVPFSNDNVAGIPYSVLKSLLSNGYGGFIFRFYKTDGSGPFFAFNSGSNYSVSATVVSSYSADKITALDSLYREKETLKAKYNTLVSFINELGKKTLTAKEQQIYNEATQLRITMLSQMQSVKGLEFNYSNTGGVGFIFLPLIAWIAVAAIVGGMIAKDILIEFEKTKRINAGYDMNKFIADKKIQLAADVKSGKITQAQANDIIKTLDAAGATANASIKESSKDEKGLLGGIGDILKIGIVFLIVSKIPMGNAK